MPCLPTTGPSIRDAAIINSSAFHFTLVPVPSLCSEPLNKERGPPTTIERSLDDRNIRNVPGRTS